MIASHQRDWYDHLFAVQFAYNTAYHTTVGDIPYRIIFKDSPRTTLQVAADLEHSESIDEHLLPSVYADREQQRAGEMYGNVHERSIQMKQVRKQQYGKRFQNFRKYKIGDLVWITATSRRVKSRSLSPRWTGPYVVIRPLSDVIYLLQRHRGRKVITLHHDRMKPYNSRPTHLLPNDDLETKSQSVGKRKVDTCSSQERKSIYRVLPLLGRY